MANRLTMGISEDKEFKRPPLAQSDLSPSGRYGPALALVEQLLSSPSTEQIHLDHWQRCLDSGSTLPAANYESAKPKFCSDLRFILIYEAECARQWQIGPPDYRATLRAYQDVASTDAKRIKGALEELRRFDRKHAYLLRHAIQRALEGHLSDKKVKRVRRPNANEKRGFRWKTISGPAVRDNEFQFLSRVSFFHFEELLEAWEQEIDAMFKPWPANWFEFGALRFEERVTPRAAAKMNIAQLGLVANLMSRIRDFNAGLGIQIYATGQPIPTHGRPCWPIVAEFVNCALEPSNPHTGDSIRRVWQSFAARHQVTLQSWPKPARTESQVQKL